MIYNFSIVLKREIMIYDFKLFIANSRHWVYYLVVLENAKLLFLVKKVEGFK